MKGEYGESAKGNFKVIDTLATVHPYCITPRHISVASDSGGMLNDAAIKEAEKRGASCGVRGCTLSYEEHETVLLIECKEYINNNAELNEYLLSIKDECEKNNYVGFAFKDMRSIH